MPQNHKEVLICTMGYVLAHVGRTLLVAKELRKLGFEVQFSGQGRYMELVRQENFDVITTDGINGEHLLAEGRRTMVGKDIFNADILDGLIQKDIELLNLVQPDAVICDLQPSMGIAAPFTGVPCINIANAYVTDYSIFPLSNFMFPPSIRPILEPIRRIFASRPFRALAAKYNFPNNTIFKDLLTRGDLVLLPDIPDFSPTKNLPDHIHYCGPLVWEPMDITTSILDGLDLEMPTLYFTLGSSGLLNLFVDVIQELQKTNFQVILTTGDQISPEELGVLPDNFFVKSYFPGTSVIQRSQAVICHGGNGTIYQALGAGKPIIAIPTHVDQKANAFLLERQGAGIQLNKRFIEKLIPFINRILVEDGFSVNAERLEQVISSLNGPQKAAEIVENYFSNENYYG